MKSAKCFFLLSILCFCTFQSSAQSWAKFEKIGLNSIVVRGDGHLEKAHIFLDNPKVNARRNRDYFYYSKGKIMKIEGGFHGHLLHGEYCNFVDKNQLKTQGWFRKGLRHGAWKEWNEAGKLISENTWKKGKLCGKFHRYTPKTKQHISGNNKGGQLHGKVRTYQSGKLISTSIYKNGELIEVVQPEAKKEKEKKEKKEKPEKKEKVEKTKKEKIKKEKTEKKQ